MPEMRAVFDRLLDKEDKAPPQLAVPPKDPPANAGGSSAFGPSGTSRRPSTPAEDAAQIRAAGEQARRGQTTGALLRVAHVLDSSGSPWLMNPAGFVKWATTGNGLATIRSAVSELAHTKAGEYWRNQQATAAAQGDFAGSGRARRIAGQVEQHAAALRSMRRGPDQAKGMGQPYSGNPLLSPGLGTHPRANASALLDEIAARAQRAKGGMASRNSETEPGFVFEKKPRANGKVGSGEPDEVGIQQPSSSLSSSEASPSLQAKTQKPQEASASSSSRRGKAANSPLINVSDRFIPLLHEEKEHLQTAMDAINDVHRVWDIPYVRVLALPLSKMPVRNGEHSLGYYNDKSPGGKITVAHDGPYPALTSVHEIGHALMKDAFGKIRSYGSANKAALVQFEKALDGTTPIITLNHALETGKLRAKQPDKTFYSGPVDANHVRYLLNPQEQFARFYTQYIATESKHPELMRQWKIFTEDLANQQHHTFWNDDDYASLKEEFEKILGARKWLNQ